MYTHCPNCDTHFEITQEYLDIAHGKVRCGQCDHIFNALENLYNEKTSEPAEEISKTVQDTPDANEASTNSQFKSTEYSVPNVDIKEKMERIVASLSAATAELKNARKTTTFHKPVIEKIPEEITPAAEEQTLTGDPLLDDELLQIEDTQLADELSQIEDSLEIDEIPYSQSSVEADNASPAEEALEVTEAPLTEEALEVNETSHTEKALEVDETSHTEEALEVDETSHIEEALEIEEIPTVEDELEIVDFNDDELVQTDSSQFTDFSAHKVDQNDIDILNSLIEHDSKQSISDSELHDELDDINQTLSDDSVSLDDEYASLDDEFDQLDNGDDLLAELEQLESDFLNNTQTSESHNADKDQPDTDSSSLTEHSQTNHSTEETGASLEDFYTSRASFEEKNDTEDTQLNSASEAAALAPIQDEVAPSFLTQDASSSSTPSAILGWLTATIVILALLASQYLHFNSIKFSQDPEIRPFLESLCPLTGCPLPLIKSPKKIVTVTHDVRTHPSVNNALEIQLTFKNKAAYTQSYPVLEITFSNPVGEIIARRKFLPKEYLKKNNSYTSGLKSNQSQDIDLSIVDPDPGSLLSFQFNYL